jgi:hypothetical protein
MKDADTTLEDDRKANGAALGKRPYAAPKLVEIGKVRDLTAGISGSGGDVTRKRK